MPIGEVSFASGMLSFRSARVQVDLPIDGIQIRGSGQNLDVAEFSHPARSEWIIQVLDSAILSAPELAEHPNVHQRLKQLRAGSATMSRLILAVCIILTLFLAGLTALIWQLPALAAKAVDRIPHDLEVELGRTVFDKEKTARKVLTPEKAPAEMQEKLRMLDKTKTRLQATLGATPYAFEMAAITDAEPNAFALPGGFMIVTSGLLEMADSPDELAGVMAHEMAHVTKRHGLRKMVQSLGLWVVLSALVGNGGGDFGSILTSKSGELIGLSYSRDAEREADEVGLQYVQRAQFDPHGMIRMFEKLEASSKGSKVPAMFNTHPEISERISRLKARLGNGDTKN